MKKLTLNPEAPIIRALINIHKNISQLNNQFIH